MWRGILQDGPLLVIIGAISYDPYKNGFIHGLNGGYKSTYSGYNSTCTHLAFTGVEN